MTSRLLFALLCLSPWLVSSQGLRTALVIGNSKYEAAVGPLRNATNDAKAVAKTLRELGFTVIEEHNVTRDDLLKAVAKFRQKVTGAEVALFYYAGHGISVAGSNYLIPVKSGYSSDVGDDTTRRLLAETKLFNAEQTVAEMSAAGARCNLVILDACRNTPLARDPSTRDATQSGGLAEMSPPAGSLIAFATDAGRTAHDGTGVNGLYTEELLKNMRTPGLSIEQVFKRTRAGVLERSGGAQIPAEYSRVIGEDVYLAGAAAPAPAPAPMEVATVVAPEWLNVMNLAKAGKMDSCATAIEALLEKAKEQLKDALGPTTEVESAMKTCQTALEVLNDALPADHAKKALLTAKAQNRLGDSLLLFGRADQALEACNAALSLTPDDAYIIYNRGCAHRALGDDDLARADFDAVVKSKSAKPGAKKLAQEALAAMK